MKKILENNLKTREYLESLPKIYLVGFWAKYGVREFVFSGKYTYIDSKRDKNRGKYVPLVYQYDDHNGTCDHYFLRPIYYTTTGAIITWTFSKSMAEEIAEAFNNKS